MREAELRSRIRDLLSSGTLPRQLPAAAQMDPSRVVASPHIRVGVQAEGHCFVCGEAKPMVSYTYSDGRVIRLHSACDNVWHEERERT
jgi:predicted nucleic acid-binding Zn ribbon protein